MRSQLAHVAGTSDIRKALSASRQALRAKKPDPDAARAALTKAIALFGEEVHWRGTAKAKLLAEPRHIFLYF